MLRPEALIHISVIRSTIRGTLTNKQHNRRLLLVFVRVLCGDIAAYSFASGRSESAIIFMCKFLCVCVIDNSTSDIECYPAQFAMALDALQRNTGQSSQPV
jgi:hypothetical protein